MNKFSAAVLAAFLACAMAPAQAKTPEELMTASGCMGCHAIDKKGPVGPGYKEVAAKYRGDKTAEAKLFEKVKKGGGGVWGGPIPMPPQSQVKDEDIKVMVKYILSLK
ncbi:MAG TPA: c-type cytochrome [Burkholderiales bacterium]|nr:c-type cytochrome [Burkholderiales bacterium]